MTWRGGNCACGSPAVSRGNEARGIGAAPGTTRPLIGCGGMLLRFVSRGTGALVPIGGSAGNPPVSVGSPAMERHGTVGSVPAMKNSVVSTPGQPGTHSLFDMRSTVFVMMPAGRGQSGGGGLRRYTSVMNAVHAGAAR